LFITENVHKDKFKHVKNVKKSLFTSNHIKSNLSANKNNTKMQQKSKTSGRYRKTEKKSAFTTVLYAFEMTVDILHWYIRLANDSSEYKFRI